VARFAALAAPSEESPEDLVLRLRDPRTFGTFAVALLSERDLQSGTKILLAEHAFDLLPLPRGEADVVLVESRAPPRLLDLASFLAAEDRLTVLHVMHLLFAVFLDRSLVTNVERHPRSTVLRAVVGNEETPERIRALYAAIHLAAVPEPEAHRAFQDFLKGGASDSLKRILVTIASSEDGGRRALAEIASQEGLFPGGGDPSRSPSVAANIPRLPERLAAPARRWLARARTP
jgi:hypothetical protein